MTFITHTNLPLELIALAVGTALIIWAFQNKGDGSALATFVGSIIFIFMSVAVVVTLYMGYINWNTSLSVTPMDMQMMKQMKMHMKSMEMNKEVNKPQ